MSSSAACVVATVSPAEHHVRTVAVRLRPQHDRYGCAGHEGDTGGDPRSADADLAVPARHAGDRCRLHRPGELDRCSWLGLGGGPRDPRRCHDGGTERDGRLRIGIDNHWSLKLFGDKLGDERDPRRTAHEQHGATSPTARPAESMAARRASTVSATASWMKSSNSARMSRTLVWTSGRSTGMVASVSADRPSLASVHSRRRRTIAATESSSLGLTGGNDTLLARG